MEQPRAEVRASATESEQRLEGRSRRPAWLRLYPFEIAAWAGLVIGVVYLRSRGLRIDWVTVEYTVPPLIPVMGRFFLIGIVLYLFYAWIREGSPKPYLRRIFNLGWLLLSLRLWLAIIVFTYTYFWLKVCVPLVNARLWDEVFWDLDILIHLGFSPSIFLVELFELSGLLPWIDIWYGLWLPSVSLGIAFFCAFPSSLFRQRFLLSCVLLWTLGAWLYVALPAVGPIYVHPEHWNERLPQIPRADGAQRLLQENYETVVAGRTGGLKQFNPTRGVAAMPSLHVGAHWLLMLWCRRRARPLFVPVAIGSLLTLLGSVVTGWHYAIDGYAGILLAQLVYWSATRCKLFTKPVAATPNPPSPLPASRS